MLINVLALLSVVVSVSVKPVKVNVLESLGKSEFRITESQVKNYRKQNQFPLGLQDKLLDGLLKDSYKPTLAGLTEHSHAIADSMSEWMVPIVFEKRVKLRNIFYHSGLGADEIDTIFKVGKIDTDLFVNYFRKNSFTDGKALRLREAFNIFKETEKGMKFGQIRDLVRRSTLLLEKPTLDPLFHSYEIELRRSEIALQFARNDFNMVMYNLFPMDSEDLLKTVKERFNTGYLASLASKWIPNIERKDQILVSSLVMQLFTEQNVFIKIEDLGFEKSLVANVEARIDSFLDNLAARLDIKYGENTIGLIEHMKALLKLQNQLHMFIEQPIPFQNSGIDLVEAKNLLQDLKIDFWHFAKVFKNRPLDRADGEKFRAVYTFLLTNNVPMSTRIKQLSSNNYFLEKSTNWRKLSKVELSYRKSEILLALKTYDRESFLKNSFRANNEVLINEILEEFKPANIENSVSDLVKKWIPQIGHEDRMNVISPVVKVYESLSQALLKGKLSKKIVNRFERLIETTMRDLKHNLNWRDYGDLLEHLESKLRLALFHKLE